jgi:hypothetical protein
MQFPWRREALTLYRDILRTSRAFTWKTDKGEVWGKVLAASARVEFEQARDETVRAVSRSLVRRLPLRACGVL